jgi:hypothetical protein
VNAAYELSRFHRLYAQLQADADGDRQPEPRQFCADDDAESEPLFTPFEALILAIMLGAAAGVYFAHRMGWV